MLAYLLARRGRARRHGLHCDLAEGLLCVPVQLVLGSARHVVHGRCAAERTADNAAAGPSSSSAAAAATAVAPVQVARRRPAARSPAAAAAEGPPANNAAAAAAAALVPHHVHVLLVAVATPYVAGVLHDELRRHAQLVVKVVATHHRRPRVPRRVDASERPQAVLLQLARQHLNG